MKKAKIIIDGKTYEAELVEVIEEPEFDDTWEPDFNEPWEPERGCEYNFIRSSKTDDTLNDGVYFDMRQRLCGNMFKTKEIAEFELKRESLMRRMRNFARANESNIESCRFSISYCHEQDAFKIWNTFDDSYSPEDITFATHEVAEEAIRRYGDEIKELYEEEA